MAAQDILSLCLAEISLRGYLRSGQSACVRGFPEEYAPWLGDKSPSGPALIFMMSGQGCNSKALKSRMPEHADYRARRASWIAPRNVLMLRSEAARSLSSSQD